MAGQETELVKLARDRFEDLTPAEVKILERCASGDLSDCSEGTDQKEPAQAADWSPERSVRSGLLRWLCVHPDAVRCVDARGLRIKGVRLQGKLNLRSVTLQREIVIESSSIPDGVDLRSAELRHISLSGTHTTDVSADGLVITHGDVFLREGFEARGSVRLVGASIKGDLECEGGRFINPSGQALLVDRADIGGDVGLRYGFCSVGTVSLIGARVRGSVSCSGGRFLSRSEAALILDHAEIGAGLWLDESFKVHGLVQVSDAKVTGGIFCGKAYFRRTGTEAFLGKNLTVMGDVNFSPDFRTNGMVDLSGSSIQGGLSFEGAVFLGSGENGLKARALEVKHGFAWKKVRLTGRTSLDLTHAAIDQLIDDRESWPTLGRLRLEDLTYNVLGGSPANARERIEWLNLQDTGEFSPQPYEQLAGFLRRSGHETDAREVSIAREEARRKYGGLTKLSRFWNWLLGATIKHGYRVDRAVFAALVLIALGWGVFYTGGDLGLMSPADTGVAERPPIPPSYPVFNSFIYSVDTFLPIVDLHQEEYWLPNANASVTWVWSGEEAPGGKYLLWYLWFHIAIGWVVTTLVVAGFTGLVRRE